MLALGAIVYIYHRLYLPTVFSATVVGSDLRKKILHIYDRFLSGDGAEVDYDGIAASQEFKEYDAIRHSIMPPQLFSENLFIFSLCLSLSLSLSLSFSYVEAAHELQRLDVLSLSRMEVRWGTDDPLCTLELTYRRLPCTLGQKMAFFINIYNALVVHAIVSVGPPSGMWARQKVSSDPGVTCLGAGTL